jgi:hypothetical protein
MTMRFEWEMTAEGWAKAEQTARLNLRDSWYDRQAHGFHDELIRGTIRIFVDDVRVYPDHDQYGELFGEMRHDLAFSVVAFKRLGEALPREPDGTEMRWGPATDEPYLRLFKEGESIFAKRYAKHPTLFDFRLPEFNRAVSDYSMDFVPALEREAPSTLFWRSFKGLLPFASSSIQQLVAAADSAPAFEGKEPESQPRAHRSGRLELEWYPHEIDWRWVRAELSRNLPESNLDLYLQTQKELFVAPLTWTIDGMPLQFHDPIGWSYARGWHEGNLQSIGYRWPRVGPRAPWDHPWPLLGIALQAARSAHPDDFAVPDDESPPVKSNEI